MGFFSPVELAMVKEPVSRVPKCGACGLYKGCKSPKMPPGGQGRKRILVVAEAPGVEADLEGTHLEGATRSVLANALRRHGIDLRKDCWVTSALICHPPGSKVNDRTKVEYCRPNLINTIEKLKPEVILPLGWAAVASLIGHLWKDDVGSIQRWAGYQIPCQRLNAWICPTFHPLFMNGAKDPVMDRMFEKHIQAASKLRDRPFEEVPDYKSQVEILYNPMEVMRRLSKIKDGVVAFDFETNMLKPDSQKAQIYSCAVCHNGKETFAFPWSGVQAGVARLLRDPNVRKIACNAKFEDRWTRRKVGTRVRGWIWDTMLSAHNLENASKVRLISSLKFQAFVHLGQEDYDSHISPYLKGKTKGGNHPNQIHKISLPALLLYNGMDALLEYRLAELQIQRNGGKL